MKLVIIAKTTLILAGIAAGVDLAGSPTTAQQIAPRPGVAIISSASAPPGTREALCLTAATAAGAPASSAGAATCPSMWTLRPTTRRLLLPQNRGPG